MARRAGEQNRTATLRITKAALHLGATPAWSRRRDLEPSTTHLQNGGCTLRVGTALGEGIEPTVSFDGRLTAAYLAIRYTLECGEDHAVLPVFLSTNRRGCPHRFTTMRATSLQVLSKVECFHEHRFGLRDLNPRSQLQRLLSCQLDEARKTCGTCGGRTRDRQIKNLLLLPTELTSHIRSRDRVGCAGLEPATVRLKGGCYYQLS